LAASWCPTTSTRWIAKITTATGIHRRNKLKPRRIGDMMVGAGNDNRSSFKGLAKRIKNNARKFSQLIKK
jgi:hypothetical protein